ncbi:MAG: MFS transporter [Steroidobacteraceae bacterium]
MAGPVPPGEQNQMILQRHRWTVLAVLVAINVLAYADRAMINAFAPQITSELGLSDTQYGILTGMVWVLSFGVMVLFLGSLADRYSRPRIIAAGVLVWSVCTAASGWAHDFGHMVAARFFVASGEAALVPAATAIIAEIFDAKQRGTVNGLFFIGMPLGIGCAYLVSGTLGTAIGWRNTYHLLGAIGVAIALPIALVPDERSRSAHPEDYGEPFARQARALIHTLAARPNVVLAIAGFVIAHVVFAQNSFLPLWLVRERGADAAHVAREIGLLQIGFGGLGAILGGLAGDRFARLPGGHADFPVLSLGVCVPLMVASRFAAVDSPLFHAGLAANFFLPFSLYACTIAILQGELPERMRATAVGFTMMCINFIAIATGTLIAGAASDYLAATGQPTPLRTVLLGTDLVAGTAIAFYLASALIRWRRSAAEVQSQGRE